MATTHSNDYQIKKIGTGLESGTWGDSTSQNFERITDIIGRSVSLDITSMPTGSTSSSADGTTDAIWVTLNAADSLGSSSDDGSEGRAHAVEFVSTSLGASATLTVEIAGATSTTKVNRTYVILNNVDNSNDLEVRAQGTASPQVTIKNGQMAFVQIVSSVQGGWSIGAHRLLDSMALSDLTLDGATGSITFVGNATINIEANDAASFKISDGVNDLVNIDTTSGTEVITLDAVSGVTVDVSGGGTQAATIKAHANSNAALVINDGTNAKLTVDTSAEEVKVGTSGNNVDLRVYGDIYGNDAARDIILKTNTAAALEIKDDAGSPVTMAIFDTTTAKPIVDFPNPITTPDISITGSDGYIEFASEAFDGTGYGFRNNSGTMQSKNTGGAWTDFAGFAWELAIAAATQSEGNDKQGAFDIGPLRFIFNTFSPTSATETVTLGDAGDGTSANMNSALYFVSAHGATAAGGAFQVSSYVLSSTGRTFRMDGALVSGSFYKYTYITIGDSGA